MTRAPDHGGRPRRAAAVLLLAWLVLGAPSLAADEVVGLGRGQGELWIDFRLDGVLEEDVLESLRSGLPSRVRHRVELWQKRSTLWDRRLVETERRYRVVFDLIEETFDLFDEGGLLETNLERSEVESRLAEMAPRALCALDRLEPGDRYYVAVEIVVEPLSVEEVRDLERWLQGSLREGDEGGVLRRLPSQLLGVFKNQVGLGERRHEARSRVFRPDELEDAEG